MGACLRGAWRARTLPSAVLAAAALLAAMAYPAAVDASEVPPDLEKRIEQARKELDEAARKLGELHSQMWRLETTGPHAQRPMLGIVIDDSGAHEGGIELVGVSPGGGAEAAGLETGDRLVAINGVRLDARGEAKPLHLFAQAMDSVKAGDPVQVEYVRDGRTYRAEVVTQARGHFMSQMYEKESDWLEDVQALARMESLEALEDLEDLDLLAGGGLEVDGDVVKVPAGLRLEKVSGDLAGYFEVERGVLVLATPGRESTLKAGDILLEVNGTAADDPDAVLAALGKLTGQVPVRVKRRGRVRDLTVDADALNADQAMQVVGDDRRIRIHRADGDRNVRVEIVVED
ncbi:MAG TPA: PDZ domain-containing protein [Pseudomonadales bacterium]